MVAETASWLVDVNRTVALSFGYFSVCKSWKWDIKWLNFPRAQDVKRSDKIYGGHRVSEHQHSPCKAMTKTEVPRAVDFLSPSWEYIVGTNPMLQWLTALAFRIRLMLHKVPSLLRRSSQSTRHRRQGRQLMNWELGDPYSPYFLTDFVAPYASISHIASQLAQPSQAKWNADCFTKRELMCSDFIVELTR